MTGITPTHRPLVVLAGEKPEAYAGLLQTSSEMALVLAPGQPLLPVLEEPEETQEASKELVAAAASHLQGLLSFLMKAARNSWELPTSQVQLLVSAKPRGITFARYGSPSGLLGSTARRPAGGWSGEHYFFLSAVNRCAVAI